MQLQERQLGGLHVHILCCHCQLALSEQADAQMLHSAVDTNYHSLEVIVAFRELMLINLCVKDADFGDDACNTDAFVVNCPQRCQLYSWVQNSPLTVMKKCQTRNEVHIHI